MQSPKSLRTDDDNNSTKSSNNSQVHYITKNISQVHYISNQRIPETGDTSGVMIEYQVGTFRWILTKRDFDQDRYLHLLVKESESEGAPIPAHFDPL